MTTFKLFTSPYSFATPKVLSTLLEEHRGARFVEEIACKLKNGGWSEEPAIVFYQEKPPKPEYSKFFAYNRRYYSFDDPPQWYITGLTTFDPVVNALLDLTDDGGVLTISRFRHDFVQSPVSERCIDGGRDYLRTLGSPTPVVRLNLLDLSFELNGKRYNVQRF